MTLKYKHVEDLLWCLKSPSLITGPIQDESMSVEVLDTLDADTLLNKHSNQELNARLSQHLTQGKSHFLGPYFEQLWSFYLQHHPDYNLIAENLQVHGKSKTLGEFDFIVQDVKSGRFLHQELAIKFYLGHEQDGKAYWIGPQTVDRLDKKMAHLLNHQLRLSEMPEAKAVLHALGIDKIETQLLIKGYLFQPAHLQRIPLPENINANHNSGLWLPKSLFLNELTEGKYQTCYWQILNKLEWLSEQCHPSPERTFSSQNLQSHLDFSRPILLSRIEYDNNKPIELEKLFVVSDDWPHLTKSAPAL